MQKNNVECQVFQMIEIKQNMTTNTRKTHGKFGITGKRKCFPISSRYYLLKSCDISNSALSQTSSNFQRSTKWSRGELTHKLFTTQLAKYANFNFIFQHFPDVFNQIFWFHWNYKLIFLFSLLFGKLYILWFGEG